MMDAIRAAIEGRGELPLPEKYAIPEEGRARLVQLLRRYDEQVREESESARNRRPRDARPIFPESEWTKLKIYEILENEAKRLAKVAAKGVPANPHPSYRKMILAAFTAAEGRRPILSKDAILKYMNARHNFQASAWVRGQVGSNLDRLVAEGRLERVKASFRLISRNGGAGAVAGAAKKNGGQKIAQKKQKKPPKKEKPVSKNNKKKEGDIRKWVTPPSSVSSSSIAASDVTVQEPREEKKGGNEGGGKLSFPHDVLVRRIPVRGESDDDDY